jgi:uncharacterized protein YbjT (DUF2867 family)
MSSGSWPTRAYASRPSRRSRRVDLVSGAGVHAALVGASAVIDVANVVTTRQAESVEFFTRATENLLRACRETGVQRYVVLSIVGIDEFRSGYYPGKLAQERLVEASGVSSTILRATQFHEFAGQMLSRFGRGPVAFIPKIMSRPVAAAAVAERLARLAVLETTPRRQDMAGPECLLLTEMVRRLCRWRGERRLLVPVRVPGATGRAMANGALLPRGSFLVDGQSFGQWLQGQPGRSRPPVPIAAP